MNRQGWLVIGLLVIGLTGTAQNKLLFHKNRFREAIYKIGDPLTFRVKGSREKIHGMIDSISDTTFVVNQISYKPSDIDRLYIDNKTRMWFAFRYKWERLFYFGGIGFLLIDVINTGEVAKETLFISSTLVGAGLLARWLIPWHINIKKQRKMIILRDPKIPLKRGY